MAQMALIYTYDDSKTIGVLQLPYFPPLLFHPIYSVKEWLCFLPKVSDYKLQNHAKLGLTELFLQTLRQALF